MAIRYTNPLKLFIAYLDAIFHKLRLSLTFRCGFDGGNIIPVFLSDNLFIIVPGNLGRFVHWFSLRVFTLIKFEKHQYSK